MPSNLGVGADQKLQDEFDAERLGRDSDEYCEEMRKDRIERGLATDEDLNEV